MQQMLIGNKEENNKTCRWINVWLFRVEKSLSWRWSVYNKKIPGSKGEQSSCFTALSYMETQGWNSRLSWRQMWDTFSSCVQGRLIWQHQFFLPWAITCLRVILSGVQTQRAVQDLGCAEGAVLCWCRRFAVSNRVVSRASARGTVGFAAGLDDHNTSPAWTRELFIAAEDQWGRDFSLWVWIWGVCTLLSLSSQSLSLFPCREAAWPPGYVLLFFQGLHLTALPAPCCPLPSSWTLVEWSKHWA